MSPSTAVPILELQRYLSSERSTAVVCRSCKFLFEQRNLANRQERGGHTMMAMMNIQENLEFSSEKSCYPSTT